MTVSRVRVALYTIAAIVSLAGLADATYLTVQALTGETLTCGGSPDCFRVLGSAYARVAGSVRLPGILLRLQPGDVRGLCIQACGSPSYTARCRDVSSHSLAALCAGLRVARLLSLLFILCRDHFLTRWSCDCYSTVAS